MLNANLPAAYLGDTYIISFELKQANGVAQNLTDCALKFGVSEANCLKSPYLTKTIGSGITVNDEANGKGVIRLEKGELSRTGMMAFELEATMPSGESYTFAQGRFQVKEAMFPTT
jgi:hypothetical protein